MIEVRQTLTFKEWLESLKDRVAAQRINIRIARLEAGLFGDARFLEGKIGELKVDHGPGYRVYFTRRGNTIVILLCGGDKKTQNRDIRTAQEMAAELEQAP